MNTQPSNPKQPSSVEGEGSITADRRYRAGVERTVKSGQVDQLAHAAEEALQGPEAEELRAAEKAGKAGKAGKDSRLSKLSTEELARAEGEGMVAPLPEKSDKT